jgi:hypothetical protein
MAFDIEHGELLLPDGLRLHRGLHRADLTADARDWEAWLHHRDEPVCYRWLQRPARQREALVVILLFWPDDGPLRGWELAPLHLVEGVQARPEGPRTRALRDWFLQRHGTVLPCRRDWGEVDAAHDPRNLSSTLVCSYALR